MLSLLDQVVAARVLTPQGSRRRDLAYQDTLAVLEFMVKQGANTTPVELTKHFDFSRSTAKKHLDILHAERRVIAWKIGQQTWYGVSSAELHRRKHDERS